ncbi:MAG: hypothetical protein ACHQ6T_08835 [Myxococcota bacterium]
MTVSQRAATLCVLAAALGCGRGERAPAPQPDAAVATNAAVPTDPHIDPAPYRAQIELAETLLYSSDALGDDGWKALSRSLLDLHNAIVFRDTSPPAREASQRLFLFSAQVDAATSGKHRDEELAVMRGVWEKIRADQFASADWFHTASR